MSRFITHLGFNLSVTCAPVVAVAFHTVETNGHGSVQLHGEPALRVVDALSKGGVIEAVNAELDALEASVAEPGTVHARMKAASEADKNRLAAESAAKDAHEDRKLAEAHATAARDAKAALDAELQAAKDALAAVQAEHAALATSPSVAVAEGLAERDVGVGPVAERL